MCLSAGAKNRKGKTAETSNPIVSKQVILKTEKKKIRSGNRSMLLKDMELNIEKSAK